MVEGVQRLGYPLLIDCVLVSKQVYSGYLVRIEAQQTADVLGGLALVAEGVPDDAHPQIRDADALRELGHADQALNLLGVEFVWIGLGVLIFEMVSVGGLHFGLLLVAGKEQELVRLLVGQIAH